MLWILLVAVLLGGQFLWLFLLRGTHLFHRDGVLIGGQILLCIAVIGIAVLLRTTPADAIRLRRRLSEWIIMLGVIALQLASIMLLLPGLSEDVLRYRSDGRMWLAGQSPYATAPMDFSGSDAIDSLVPFPDVPTIYPGSAQGAFALGAWVEQTLDPAPREVQTAPASAGGSPWRWYLAHANSPYRATVFRAIFALAMVLAVMGTLRLLREMDCSAWWAVPLAWNPLATLETGGMDHADAIGVMFIVVALWALHRARLMRCGAWLALASGIKPPAMLLLPFALRSRREGEALAWEGEAPVREGEAPAEPAPVRKTRLGRSLALPGARLALACAYGFAIVLLLSCVVPLLYQHGYAGWRQTMHTYSHSWEANGSIYNLITRAFGHGDEGRAMSRAKEMARLLSAAVVLGAGIIAWETEASVATAGYVLTMAALLVSPVVYPWYALWPLVFVPFLRGRAGLSALVWSGTISMSYLLWREANWKLTSGTLMVEYLPVYAAVAMELCKTRVSDERECAARSRADAEFSYSAQ